MLFAYIWLIIGILMLIVEIFTADFLFASIGISCLIASIPAFMGAGLVTQTIVFAISAIIFFATIRPIVKKIIQGKNRAKELGLNTLVNKKGVVSEEIVNSENRGRVKINGDLWRAYSETNENIEEGASIVVKRAESTIVYVEKIN